MAEGSGALNLDKTGSVGHDHLQVSNGLSQDKVSRHYLWYPGAELKLVSGLEPQQERSPFIIKTKQNKQKTDF